MGMKHLQACLGWSATRIWEREHVGELGRVNSAASGGVISMLDAGAHYTIPTALECLLFLIGDLLGPRPATLNGTAYCAHSS
eukprot:6601880-Pyramimonas_sp.AAC.1